MKIGVFDSGLGGLSILRQFITLLPEYDYVYFADNKHAPYGDRTQEDIYLLTQKAVDFLFNQNAQLIILACNTATAVALRRLQQTYLLETYPERKILGVIRPAVESLIDMNIKKAGIIATQATVTSKSFIHELHKLTHDIELIQQATPLLVPKIEAGELNSLELEKDIETYLRPLKDQGIEALLLGCTHYELIEDLIRKHIPPHIPLVAEGKVTAEKLNDYLHRHPEIERNLSKKSTTEFFSTHMSDTYHSLVSLFLKGYLPYTPKLHSLSL